MEPASSSSAQLQYTTLQEVPKLYVSSPQSKRWPPDRYSTHLPRRPPPQSPINIDRYQSPEDGTKSVQPQPSSSSHSGRLLSPTNCYKTLPLQMLLSSHFPSVPDAVHLSRGQPQQRASPATWLGGREAKDGQTA